jgi:hypothetical protein
MDYSREGVYALDIVEKAAEKATKAPAFLRLASFRHK